MKTAKNSNLLVTSNPHIVDSMNTTKIMSLVVIALLPSLIASVVIFGARALILAAVCIVASMFFEWAYEKIAKKPSTVGDLSAVVTGLLIAMNVPVTLPYWMAVIGCFVAIVIVKQFFGGLGQNLFNPAITGRVFLLISFPTYMTDWSMTRGFVPAVDAVSGATPLSALKEALKSGSTISDFLADKGLTINQLMQDIGASAGEISSIALLVGFAYLLVRRVVKPWIPLSIIVTVAVISGIFSTVNPELYTGPAFNIFTGGMILGACFMATDYVTSPMSTLGGVIYGIGIGVIVMMIRYFGAYPEGMSFAILIMNCVVPLLNNWFHGKKYGRA